MSKKLFKLVAKMPMMMLELDECDQDASVSMTWSIDPSGTMRHKPSGMKVSASGITNEGSEYRLGPEDIELEGDGRLGAGAGGVVIKGTIKKTGQQVAVKTVKVDDKSKRDQLLNEIRGLVKAQNSANLVQWYAAFLNKKTNAVHVVLELMDLGSLRDLIRRAKHVPPTYLKSISLQIMLGLEHLFRHHLLHRDIKPENVLHNTRGEVKLTDFGIARELSETLAVAGTFVGTATYMSPERCLGMDYNFSSDIWSVGMVLYELATGRYPFADCSTFPALFEHVTEKPEPRLDEGVFPPDLCQFTGLCLIRDVAKRPDTAALLGHPFVKQQVPSQAELAAYFATVSS